MVLIGGDRANLTDVGNSSPRTYRCNVGGHQQRRPIARARQHHHPRSISWGAIYCFEQHLTVMVWLLLSRGYLVPEGSQGRPKGEIALYGHCRAVASPFSRNQTPARLPELSLLRLVARNRFRMAHLCQIWESHSPDAPSSEFGRAWPGGCLIPRKRTRHGPERNGHWGFRLR